MTTKDRQVHIGNKMIKKFISRDGLRAQGSVHDLIVCLFFKETTLNPDPANPGCALPANIEDPDQLQTDLDLHSLSFSM